MVRRTLANLCVAIGGGLLISLVGCGGGPDQTQVPTASPGDHVSFFVIGKSWNFDQNADGELELVDLGYFAEIFKTPGGVASDANMRLQASAAEAIPFVREADGGAVMHARAGQRHQSVETLDAELPNGDYGFNFVTPAGTVENFSVTLAGDGGSTDLPPGPMVTLFQDERIVNADAIRPAVDVRVTWTPFDTGRADPNGIADDLIFVLMGDCHDERAFHSGRPLGTPNPLEPDEASATLLTYADDEVVIPGSAFTPGMRYILDVEHARLLDTDKRQGVVGMSTYAVTTHVTLQTTGEGQGIACPEPATD